MPKLYHVDAFTAEKFKGNPAAVCLLDEISSEDWMQAVAMEMNLSETAFVLRLDHHFALRWFTPKVEVDLCGHATLATAHVLYEAGILKPSEEAVFKTKSGILKAAKKGDWIEMDFPSEPAAEIEVPYSLVQALQITPRYSGKNRFDYLVLLDTEEQVRALEPDYELLKKTTERGVIVTSPSESPHYDFVSRFFAPAAGINEDPVTGSSHCCLGPFWMDRVKKTEFIAYQASPRGGIVKVGVDGNRVKLAGHAVTVLKGELL